MINLPKIDDLDLKGKRVFVRGDIDVPLKEENSSSVIADDTRLKDIWLTIEFILGRGGSVVLAGHLGRPEGKVDQKLSSKPVAVWMAKKMDKLPETITETNLEGMMAYKIDEKFSILENLRFFPGEEKNDPDLAAKLAKLADIFVNESFAESYREVASISGVAKILPHYIGFRLAKEVSVLDKVLNEPKRPLVVVIGGAKFDSKMPVISKMAEVADCVIVGGKLLTEINVGNPILGLEKVKLLKLTTEKKDTTLDSIDKVSQLIGSAATIIWNGPMGMVEDYTYQVGTRRIAELISSSNAYKVVGGGDTVGFLDKLGLTGKFDWVSSGGGEMLRYLAGQVEVFNG